MTLVVVCQAGLLLGAGGASAAGPETLHVAPGGSDYSCVNPCPSIQVAINDGYADVFNGLASRVTIDVAPGTYHANLAINAPISAMTITGSGIARTVVDGDSSDSVLRVGQGASATVTDMTLKDGNAPQGGGVNNAGTLTLDRMNIGLNYARYRGGGIYNETIGTLKVDDSNISLNQSSSGGGVHSEGATTLNRDLIDFNSSAGYGGGVASGFGNTTLTADTVVSNNSAQSGGGISAGFNLDTETSGTLTVSGSTITGNQANVAGGIYSVEQTKLVGTILSGNQASNCSFSAQTTSGFDLSDDTSCPFSAAAGDRVGVDPGLGGLQDNGGPTNTQAISASSPAYDTSRICGGTDQRGVSRLQRGASACDIGAYQVRAPTLYVANPPANSVTAYATGASGDAPPVLTLRGPATGLSQPTGVVVDVAGDVFVTNSAQNSVAEYAPEVNGNAAPKATISGPLTQLDQPQDLALDPAGHIFVTNLAGSVTEYAAHATGNVAPIASISGKSTQLSKPEGVILDPAGNLRVANSANGTITTYRAGATGNVAPLARLGPGVGLNAPEALAFGPAGNLLVTDALRSRVYTYAGTSQAGTLLDMLTGTPGVRAPVGLDLDARGDVFATSTFTDPSTGLPIYSVNEYPPGARGTAAALASITGADTLLNSPAFLSELPPPPAPIVKASTRRKRSVAGLLRHGLALRLAARGVLAFRSGPVTIIGTARLRGRPIATGRITLTAPGHAKLILHPVKHAAAKLRRRATDRLRIELKLHDAAGVQTKRLTVRLTR